MARQIERQGNGIGLYNEGWLHSSLKKLYSSPSAQFEVKIDGFVVDIAQNGLLVEIQTGSFYRLKRKLSSLLESYRIKVVYPLPVEKTIVVLDRNRDRVLYRRKSPKRRSELDLVDQLIYILPHLYSSRLSLEVLLTREEEVRSDDGKGSRRRGGKSILGRRLLEIMGTRRFTRISDYGKLLPADLPAHFTNLDLSQRMGISRSKATKLTYCLKHLGLLEVTHKEGRFLVFAVP